MFFSNEKDYKNLASALRRELKPLGVTTVSHNQMLEAMAKAMGHKSFAALLAAHPAASATPPTPPAEEKPTAKVYSYPVQPIQVYGFSGEHKYLAELEKYKGYRLFNDDGSLDLTDDGKIVDGLTFEEMLGTSDDIKDCTCNIYGASRDADGSLSPSHTGDTDVNWDGQKTKCDTRGAELYLDQNYNEVPSDKLIIVPEDFLDDEDEMPNLLNEEVAEELPVREELVDAVLRWLKDQNLVAQALQEMNWDENWGGFGDGFAQHADAIGEPGSKKKTSVLGQAQWVAGFAMHIFEFKALRQAMLDLT